MQHGRIQHLEIFAEPCLGRRHTLKTQVHQAEEQRSLNGVPPSGFRQSIAGNLRIVVHPSGDGDQGVGKPVAGAGDPHFLAQFLNGTVAHQIDIEIPHNPHDGFADVFVVGKLLFDDLIDPNDILVSKLGFLAVHHVLLELEDPFMDLRRRAVHLDA